MTYVRSDLSKQTVSVVPHAVKAQHVPVHLQELLQLVKGGRRDVGVEGLLARLYVGVRRALLPGVEVDALALQVLLKIV